MKKIVLQNPRVVVIPEEGVKLGKVFSLTVPKEGDEEGSLELSASDMEPKQRQILVMELEVPPGKDKERRKLAKVNLDYIDLGLGDARTLEGKGVEISYAASEEDRKKSRDNGVLVNVAIFEAADDMVKASTELEDDKLDDATKRIKERRDKVKARTKELGDHPELQALGKSLDDYVEKLGKKPRGDDAQDLQKLLQVDGYTRLQGLREGS